MKKMECSICFKNIVIKFYAIPCNHTFHENCINQWIETCLNDKRAKACPYCRTPIEIAVCTRKYNIMMKPAREFNTLNPLINTER